MNETSLLFPVFHHLTPFPVHGCVCANLPPPLHEFLYHWNGKWLHTFICFFLHLFPPLHLFSQPAGPPMPPHDVQVLCGQGPGVLQVHWKPPILSPTGTSNGANVVGYAVCTKGQRVSYQVTLRERIHKHVGPIFHSYYHPVIFNPIKTREHTYTDGMAVACVVWVSVMSSVPFTAHSSATYL